MFHRVANHPLAGGRDSPDFAAVFMQAANQCLHFEKNTGRHVGIEIFRRGELHFSFGEPRVHGDHFAAHIVLADFALAIVGIAGALEADNLIGEHSAFPAKEAFAGIASPKRAVAVKSGKTRLKVENRIQKRVGLIGEFGNCHNLGVAESES